MNTMRPTRKMPGAGIASRAAPESRGAHAFHRIGTAAPTHLLLIAKRHIVSIRGPQDADAPRLGRMMALASRAARKHGRGPDCQGGFQLVSQAGTNGGQETAQLHFHTIGGACPRNKKAAPAV
ncbi:HIT domain-containing protein [Candidimonas humi]|nr:HIT domain-containing protein [Candidimonas humi]